MNLTIITINSNNASGLRQTMKSVFDQSYSNFEYVVVDGASTDGSVDVIKEYAEKFGDRIKWVSEQDNGIYNAMNKGIRMATGEYVELLNSGDCLLGQEVVGKMIQSIKANGNPSILYGNMLKEFPSGRTLKDKCFAGKEISFLGFYSGTLNHSPAYIKRSLFEEYGMYDESLKIVSDWEWYLKAIILGKEKPVYTDIDVTLFDMTGISETNKELDKAERKLVLTKLIPATILADYDQYAFAISQFKRLKRHPWASKIVWFIERMLFQVEKRKLNRTQISEYW